MADTTHTTHATPTAAATGKTLWKNGAGVGAAVASALGSLIAVGLGASQPQPENPAVYLIPVACVAAFALLGALAGSVVGGAIPVTDDKPAAH